MVGFIAYLAMGVSSWLPTYLEQVFFFFRQVARIVHNMNQTANHSIQK
jgi:hypothetical protein